MTFRDKEEHSAAELKAETAASDRLVLLCEQLPSCSHKFPLKIYPEKWITKKNIIITKIVNQINYQIPQNFKINFFNSTRNAAYLNSIHSGFVLDQKESVITFRTNVY